MKYEYGEPLRQSRINAVDIFMDDGALFTGISKHSVRGRIIACINACAGLSNEQLEKIGRGGVGKIMVDRDQFKVSHEIDARVIAHLQASLNERKGRSESEKKDIAGPPLTPEQAAEWEWTGEQPRKLTRGESGLCVPRYDGERPWIMGACATSESTSIYWPLRRRQTPKAEEPTIPQNATLNDIADLLQRILNRMPERGV